LKIPGTPLIAIGSSAGGPGALAAILKSLPTPFSAAIVIVQHIDARFAEHMARWLNDQSSFAVRLAKNGDYPVPGSALLAGTEDHLTLTRAGVLRYTKEPSNVPYRPSVDVFFKSVLANWHSDVIGVLLTGMGRDGAHGLRGLRESGATTIAQDQMTSIVYGMPKAAVELNAVDEVLPLPAIGPRLVELTQKKLSPATRSV
jgi:two-component system response regulator WspF